MNCKICQNSVQELFKVAVLQKYQAQYFKCSNCGFIQTEEPYWLNEAYQNAITSMDIGLVYRNLSFSKITEQLLLNFFDYRSKFIDYAGGYGLFVRLMRDKGFDFYRQDPYCENIFAKNIDVINLPDNTKFELATAFEVFEHWANPLPEFEKVLNYADSILFSTEIQPSQVFSSADDWWYFVPEIGQHVSFYTLDSLKTIASIYKLNFYSNQTNLHLLTSKVLMEDPFKPPLQPSIKKIHFTEKIIRKILKRPKDIGVVEPKKILENLLQRDIENAKMNLLNEKK